MKTHTKKPIFDNAGLYAFFLYYSASLINDPIVTWFYPVPVFTPRHCAVLAGIGYCAFSRGSISSQLYRRSTGWLLVFYAVCFFSYLLCIIGESAHPPFLIVLVASGMNCLWLVVVGKVLSAGLTSRDKKNLLYGLLVMGCVPILTGLFELIRREEILQVATRAQHGAAYFFRVQGFHNDKINYVTVLAPAIFASAVLLLRSNGIAKKACLVVYLAASLLCLSQTFSIAGILGVAGGLMLLAFFYGGLGSRFVMVVLLALCGLALAYGLATESGRHVIERYEAKYERRTQSGGSPRLVAASVCIREFKKSPVWGLGFGNHVPLIFAEEGGWTGGGNAHSILSVPADLGILGSIPFVFFWCTLYASTFRFFRRSARSPGPEDKLLAGLIAGLSIFVLARLLLYYHAMNDEAFFIWVALAYASITNHRKMTRRPDGAQTDTGLPAC